MSQNIFTVEGLISWLETQPGETEYDYSLNTDCLLCRYFRFQGVPVDSVGTWVWIDTAGKAHALPGVDEVDYAGDNPLNRIASGPRWGDSEYTYTAALQRARAMVAS